MRKTQLLLLMCSVAMSVGCSSMGKQLKSFLGGSKSKKAAVARTAPMSGGGGPVRFSDRPDLTFNTQRKYRRMTKGKFEAQAKVKDKAGSLWNSDGQSAYLFSQNRVRKIGDLLNVKLVGAAKEQLAAKAKIIRRLLEKLDRERSVRSRIAAKRRANKNKKLAQKQKEGSEDKDKQGQRSPASKKIDDNFKVKEVPTRIVEKLPDGNYRVKGSQAFMIGKREYKVIVTGIVRNEDFNEEGINSGQILDPRYDIVGQRRGGDS